MHAARSTPSAYTRFDADAGRPLPRRLRAAFERALGANLEAVRISEGPAPAGLGALAFATGMHVRFAPGRYRPDTVWGQALLAHELEHVVQQHEGRVRAGVGGHPLVHDAALERAADAAARRYLRGEAASERRGRVSAAPAPAPVVQCAVGFEFQTGWQAFMEIPGPNGPRQVDFPKETSLYGGRNRADGWSMETDGRDIEFVIEPPIEESPQGMMELTRIFGSLSSFLTRLEALQGVARLTPQTHPQFFRRGVGFGQGVVIVPNGPIAAQPQVTVGVRLGRVHLLLAEMARLGMQQVNDLFERAGGFGMQGQGGYYAQAAHQTAQAAQRAGLVNGQPPSNRLRGLVSMVAQYLIQGSTPGRRDYAKDMAFAMARTDFGSMFRKLPVHERQYFEQDPDRWVRYALFAAGLPTNSGNEWLLNQMVMDGGKLPDGFRLPITRGKWLRDMTQGIDAFSARGAGNAPAFQDVSGGHRLRAPGMLGNRFDTVGGNHQGVIIELRQMRRAVPFQQWYGIARDVLSYLMRLNSSAANAGVQF